MIIAQVSDIKITEAVVERESEMDYQMQRWSAGAGIQPSMPALQTEDEDLLMQTTAIVQYIVAAGKAPHLNGTNEFEMAQVD